MSSKSSETVTLYHWAPRERRASIQREGLRRLSWRGTSLVLYAADVQNYMSIREHISDRHNCTVDGLDLWILDAPAQQVTYAGNGIWLVKIDVPNGANLRSLLSENGRRGKR